MYCIYLATNTANGKVYVGKTNNFQKRKGEHLHSKSDHLFARALRKYGESAFEWRILEDGIETLDEANNRERHWISKYNSYFRNIGSNGYNMTLGGDGGSMWNTKKIAVYTLDGKLEKYFASVTECAKYLGVKNTTNVSSACDKRERTCGGKMVVSFTDEPLPSVGPYKKGTARCIPIYRIDPNTKEIVRYDSLVEAEADGFRRSGILGCINGRYKQSFGYVWCHKEELESSISKTVEPIRAYGTGKHILQFDETGNLVAKYNNCVEAARAVSAASNKIIHKALSSDTHYSSGYYWHKE